MNQSLHIVCPSCGGINRVPRERLGEGGRCGRCKHPLFRRQPHEVDEAALQRQLSNSGIPLLVDFWAPWCGPCKTMGPAFAEAARRLEPEVRLLKLNTEEHQGIAARLGIRSIPTLILFLEGRELQRMSGAMDVGGIVDWVRRLQ
ncbi:MAG: thiol reductase thioredoxin [Candidatus Sedimenticola endophacoides]|uniref:Thioredoxin n=1 Tax=Candidatus Sedimenticola endophacoides TaxID=2548426 RepID=A0A6N4DZ98_9GAMM|nr:MAG: thiol reductase thioredoxin [Candidatus Sedimenticola endophacoides]OQX38294.1 MAG: thiol reductase thioredoxin [Candidatus Sedimenticola endophacoides]OQX41008.1 MAG: thiol reductase thioredoxin [Candidatus Sedimenticola endophacoides]PUD99394.1 MAG: thiol reductase thioredoxin [Candidatus Sedimenticola endophacoides]PUE02198.1 MAG: thiol reductase thioredoxin [Candidatus Sedimenticola endophacoides]